MQITIPLSREQRELSDKMIQNISVPSVKTVSFKLFGTLLLLPFSEELDLFQLMEIEFPELKFPKRTFSDLRIEAEAAAKRKFTEKCSVTIEQIYDILAKKAKISDDVKNRLIERECGIVSELAFQRNFGKKLFSAAFDSGKKTVIIADTIYPRKMIIGLLAKCGYEICSELIVSNEVETGENRSKSLFEAVKKCAKADADKMLHIGSDVEADVETPIMNGAKALLLSDVSANFLKSGRLRGYAQAEKVFDYDTPSMLALRLAFGLYSAYIFDIPRNKTVNSDFCGNPYILGFLVYGCVLLGEKRESGDEMYSAVVKALEENSDARRGGEEMSELYRRHFETYFGALQFVGTELPAELLANHGGAVDIGLLKKHMSPDVVKKWQENICDAPNAPTAKKRSEQNALEKFADRLFPPGTKVRSIADGVLFKMKNKL